MVVVKLSEVKGIFYVVSELTGKLSLVILLIVLAFYLFYCFFSYYLACFDLFGCLRLLNFVPILLKNFQSSNLLGLPLSSPLHFSKCLFWSGLEVQGGEAHNMRACEIIVSGDMLGNVVGYKLSQGIWGFIHS